MIGAIGDALTVLLRRGGRLMAVLVPPLAIRADLRRRRLCQNEALCREHVSHSLEIPYLLV